MPMWACVKTYSATGIWYNHMQSWHKHIMETFITYL